MNTSFTAKFAALALALFANTVLMGSVVYLFNAHPMQAVPVATAQSLHTDSVA